MYVVIITDNTNYVPTVKVYGIFESIENVQEWLPKNKYNNSNYYIDIHPLNNPDET